MIRVVCGIIFNKDKILLTRRKKGKLLEGFWEFPGGKVEKNENDSDALKRELKEELGLDVLQINYFTENKHDYNSMSINLVAYKCIANEDPRKLVDHDKYEWVSIGEVVNFNLAEADKPILEDLKTK